MRWVVLHLSIAVILFGFLLSSLSSSTSLLIEGADRRFSFGKCSMSCLMIELVFPHDYADGYVCMNVSGFALRFTTDSAFADVFQYE